MPCCSKFFFFRLYWDVSDLKYACYIINSTVQLTISIQGISNLTQICNTETTSAGKNNIYLFSIRNINYDEDRTWTFSFVPIIQILLKSFQRQFCFNHFSRCYPYRNFLLTVSVAYTNLDDSIKGFMLVNNFRTITPTVQKMYAFYARSTVLLKIYTLVHNVKFFTY